MILETFNPAHFKQPERAPFCMVQEGWIVQLHGHPDYLVVGPVAWDEYMRAGVKRAVFTADRITRDGKRGPLTVTAPREHCFITVRRPGAGADIA